MNTMTANIAPKAVPADLILQAAQEVAAPRKIIEAALLALATDAGALFEHPVVDALHAVQMASPADYARYRSRAKQINKNLRLTVLDRLTRPEGDFEESVLSRLIALAKDRCRLCHNADRDGVAIVDGEHHREVWLVRGAGFAEWLRAEYFNEYEAGVAETTLTSAIATIDAIGVNKGDKVEVHVRYAKDGDGYIVDTCDELWRAIKIDQSGWQIVERLSVLFTRNDKMRPLSVPEHGADLELLWKYANVPAAQRPLVIAWLLESMRPDTPFPVLEIVGEQGSAKSTTQRYLRDLIDPNKVPLRGCPKTIEDIYVAAASNWVVSYENLSWLANDEQDALCTLSTGGGFATRKFYTNGEEHVLEAKRPVMLNSISGVATRPDLIERTIRIDAPSIPMGERREDAELLNAWKEDYPRILGALFDLFARVLRILPDVQLKERQRMADFERLGEAVMRIDEHAPGTFSELYAHAVREGTERALENFCVADLLISYMCIEHIKCAGEWSGTVGQLYQTLRPLPLYGGSDRANWPKSARGLSDQLRRLAPALRGQGLEIVFGDRSNSGRRITIKWRGDHAKPDTTSIPPPASVVTCVAAVSSSAAPKTTPVGSPGPTKPQKASRKEKTKK